MWLVVVMLEEVEGPLRDMSPGGMGASLYWLEGAELGAGDPPWCFCNSFHIFSNSLLSVVPLGDSFDCGATFTLLMTCGVCIRGVTYFSWLSIFLSTFCDAAPPGANTWPKVGCLRLFHRFGCLGVDALGWAPRGPLLPPVLGL